MREFLKKWEAIIDNGGKPPKAAAEGVPDATPIEPSATRGIEIVPGFLEATAIKLDDGSWGAKIKPAEGYKSVAVGQPIKVRIRSGGRMEKRVVEVLGGVGEHVIAATEDPEAGEGDPGLPPGASDDSLASEHGSSRNRHRSRSSLARMRRLTRDQGELPMPCDSSYMRTNAERKGLSGK